MKTPRCFTKQIRMKASRRELQDSNKDRCAKIKIDCLIDDLVGLWPWWSVCDDGQLVYNFLTSQSCVLEIFCMTSILKD